MQPRPLHHKTGDARRLRLRLRSVILLVVAVPMLGMAAMSTILVGDAFVTRDTARQVEAQVTTLASLSEARVALAAERTASGLLVFGARFGLDEEALRTVTGVDHRAALVLFRTTVDTTTAEHLPEMADDGPRLHEVREAVDDGTASSAQVRSIFGDLTAAVDARWEAEYRLLQDGLDSGNVARTLNDRATALRATVATQRWGVERAALVSELLQAETPDPATERRLLAAATRYRVSVENLADVLGPSAGEVWDELVGDSALQRVGRELEVMDERVAAGEALTLDGDFRQALADVGAWSDGLSSLVQAAASDLSAESARVEHEAANSVQLRMAATGALILLSLAGAVLLTRSVTRSVRRLEAAAHQVRAGKFDLDRIDPSGPRELADTASAFNEMTATLASVETYATTLADAPESSLLDHELPGRTGHALQVALGNLRASIRQAEQRRAELEVTATRDSLTRLLNRSAALTMVGRDLAAARRSGGAVMALFIDLDGFKLVNDHHGHAVGDDALRLVADALRETTREADVVARIGGDEFLVAGAVANDPTEVERLATRIRDVVGTIVIDTEDGPIGLHCSIGMAMSDPDDNTALLVQRADTGMYEAKRQGQDHIAWAAPDGSMALLT